MNDLKDPAICGAKEPKIASLLWVLHDNPNDIENIQFISDNNVEAVDHSSLLAVFVTN